MTPTDEMTEKDEMIAMMAAVILAGEVSNRGVQACGDGMAVEAVRLARAAIRATMGSKS